MTLSDQQVALTMLNNREVASVIWVLLLAILALFSRSIRNSIWNLAKAMLTTFSSWRVLVPTIAMVAYISIVIAVLARVGLWTASDLKTTFLWMAGAALVMFFEVGRTGGDLHWMKVLVSTFALVVFIEFYMNLYVLSLPLELVLTPVITLVSLMSIVARSDPEAQTVRPVLDAALALTGIGLFLFVTYKFSVGWRDVATISTLKELVLPLALSLLFLPFIYVLAVYVTYEGLFLRLSFFIPDPAVRKYAKRRTLWAFHFNLGALKEWSRHLIQLRPRSKEEVLAAIDDFRRE